MMSLTLPVAAGMAVSSRHTSCQALDNKTCFSSGVAGLMLGLGGLLRLLLVGVAVDMPLVAVVLLLPV